MKSLNRRQGLKLSAAFLTGIFMMPASPVMAEPFINVVYPDKTTRRIDTDLFYYIDNRVYLTREAAEALDPNKEKFKGMASKSDLEKLETKKEKKALATDNLKAFLQHIAEKHSDSVVQYHAFCLNTWKADVKRGKLTKKQMQIKVDGLEKKLNIIYRGKWRHLNKSSLADALQKTVKARGLDKKQPKTSQKDTRNDPARDTLFAASQSTDSNTPPTGIQNSHGEGNDRSLYTFEVA